MKPEDYPWDYPGMVFCPGRWYDRTGSIALPVCGEYPFGADITYLIWRLDEKPGEWVVTWRIRRYAGPNTDPFTGGDTKKWMTNKTDDLEKARRMFSEIARLAALSLNHGRPVQHDIVEVGGTSDVFFRIMQEARPHWMHMKVVPVK